MVMEYFYHKALEAEGGETVKVDDFRYPGRGRFARNGDPHAGRRGGGCHPDPGEADPSRIKEMTKQIIDKRMLSGELDQSNLSLSDIARIRDAFVPLLTGIHHARIVYPGQKTASVRRPPGGAEGAGMILTLVDRRREPVRDATAALCAPWALLAELAATLGPPDWRVDLVLVDDGAMAELNRGYRGADGPPTCFLLVPAGRHPGRARGRDPRG